MARPVWPTDLPQRLQANNLTVQPKPSRVVNVPEVGPARTRGRTTLILYSVEGDLFLDSFAQCDDLLDFYHITLARGSHEFDWTHPFKENESVVMKFVSEGEPRISPLGSNILIARLVMEMRK